MNHAADLYQTFFNTAGDPIFLINARAKIVVEANVQAIKQTGYQPQELEGLPFERLFRPRDGSGFSFVFEATGAAARRCCDELWLLKKNGEAIAVNVSTTWVEWNSTKYLFLMACERDVTLPCIDSIVESADSSWREQEDFPPIIGQSEKIRDMCRRIGSVAKSDVTVLIQGESGTGKEIVANAIHAHSLRCRAPFVKVNCAALTETLLESELFGHVKGAFTGAIRDRRGRFKQADGGTILLDEISSMPLSGQAKLLRVVQEREFEPVGSSVTTSVNVRMIAATNADLAKAAAEGKFREDLYYRLNVFLIPLPPLRERKEDIPLLAKHFLRQYCQAIGKGIFAIAPETLRLLIEYDWPGNVRELENAIEHAVIVTKGSALLPSSLPMNLTRSRKEGGAEPSAELGLRGKLNLLEKQILLDTLLRANWIKKQAAAILRIDARNLPYLLRKHNLNTDLQPH